MIAISKSLLARISPDLAVLPPASWHDEHGQPIVFVSPLYSWGGGGNGGMDTDALGDRKDLVLVGMADRYSVAASRGVAVRQFCADDHRLPTRAERLELVPLLRAVAPASALHPVARLAEALAPIEYLVVTRHPALVQHLREQGHIADEARVVDTADEAMVHGQHVIGILPIRLAALCASYSECSLVLGPEDRGVTDLSIERVRQIAQPLTTYRVTRLG